MVLMVSSAAAYSSLGQHDQAIADCNRAIEKDPKYGKAYARLGFVASSWCSRPDSSTDLIGVCACVVVAVKSLVLLPATISRGRRCVQERRLALVGQCGHSRGHAHRRDGLGAAEASRASTRCRCRRQCHSWWCRWRCAGPVGLALEHDVQPCDPESRPEPRSQHEPRRCARCPGCGSGCCTGR